MDAPEVIKAQKGGEAAPVSPSKVAARQAAPCTPPKLEGGVLGGHGAFRGGGGASGRWMDGRGRRGEQAAPTVTLK